MTNKLNTDLDHQVHVLGEVRGKRDATVSVLPLLHDRLRTGAGLGEVLLRLNPLAVPDCIDLFDEL